MPRRKVEIDSKIFENLCGIQCELSEIAHAFSCSEADVKGWCSRHYKKPFGEVYENFSSAGKMSLRRAQYKSAMEGNVKMQMFLGRQWLGQDDKPQKAAARDAAQSRPDESWMGGLDE